MAKPRSRVRPRKNRRSKIMIIAIVLVVLAVAVSGVYAGSYFESDDAFKRVSVDCSSYVTVPHTFTDPSHVFTHYEITFGVNNPSSSDIGASWRLKATNLTYGYRGEQAVRSFSILHRDTAYATFSLFIEIANVTIYPSDLTITQDYTISLFKFHQEWLPTPSLPSCPAVPSP